MYDEEEKVRGEKSIFNQIVKLKTTDLSQEIKERELEQLIRELPIWDSVPPYRSFTKKRFSDSRDSIYIFQDESFLISVSVDEWQEGRDCESWRLYADKLTSNDLHQGFVGIFFSLHDVDVSILEESKDIHQNYLSNIIIDGDYWEELERLDMPFSNFLSGLVPSLRSQENTLPPKSGLIEEEFQNRKAIRDELLRYVQDLNANFLNSYGIANHDELYVHRRIDESVKEIIFSLRPSKLRRKAEKKFYDDPKQTNLIRDYAGSGKTTLSAQIQRLESICIPLCLSASDLSLQEVFSNVIEKCDVQSLNWIDQPLVVVIDSLDEVKNTQNKLNEIKRIFKVLDKANNEAKKAGLASYPVAVFFTVRDDYFREWESIFEGKIDNTFKRRISRFTDNELQEALNKYSKVFRYKVLNDDSLSDNAKEVLSVPINLTIFSESQKHMRDIRIDDIWEAKLITDYFDSKKKQLRKRNLAFQYDKIYYNVLSKVAAYMMKSGEFQVSQDVFENIFINENPGNRYYSSEFWFALHSEEIFSYTNALNVLSKFKYLRFLEYLVSYFVAKNLLPRGDFEAAKEAILKANSYKEISIFRITECLKHSSDRIEVKQSKFNELRTALVKDKKYLESQLKHERNNIARGKKSNQEIIEQIKLGTSFLSNPEILVDSFFVLSAKNNDQDVQLLLDFFGKAWDLSPNDRYKLLSKASARNFLTKESLIRKVLGSDIPFDWECFLGYVIETGKQREVIPYLSANDIIGKIKFNLEKNEDDWVRANYLLEVCHGRLKYQIGLSEEDIKPNSNKKLPLDKEKVGFALNELKRLYGTPNFMSITDFTYQSFSELNKAECVQLMKDFDAYLNHNQDKESSEQLVSFMIYDGKVPLLISLLENSIYHIDHGIFRHLFNSTKAISEQRLGVLLKGLYKQKFKKETSKLLKLIHDEIKAESPEEARKLYYHEVFLACQSSVFFENFLEDPNPIFTLASIKYGYPIGFKFSGLINVVNNGIQNYKHHRNYFFIAVDRYNRLSELEGYKSFNAKYNTWKESYNGTAFNIPIVEELFPELS